jgi:hypothetical protein
MSRTSRRPAIDLSGVPNRACREVTHHADPSKTVAGDRANTASATQNSGLDPV